MAIIIADIVQPIIKPPTNSGPNIKPHNTGTPIAIRDGTFISPIAPLVEISIHVL